MNALINTIINTISIWADIMVCIIMTVMVLQVQSGVPMSIVRYTNKKTGWVSIYESKPYYDPVTKQSRPKRTYIGYEDPVTKEFVPSSHKPGRKVKSVTRESELLQKQNTDSCEETINNQRAEIGELTAKIRELNQKVDSLKKQLERMKTAVSRSAEILNKAQSTSS